MFSDEMIFLLVIVVAVTVTAIILTEEQVIAPLLFLKTLWDSESLDMGKGFVLEDRTVLATTCGSYFLLAQKRSIWVV